MRVFALMLALISLPALARLGETNVQIMQRYGPVQKRYEDGTNCWHAGYVAEDFGIIVYFTNNISRAESVAFISGRAFSDDERLALMENIGASTNWAPDHGHLQFGPNCWTNSAGQMAIYYTVSPDSGPLLTVGTRSFFDQMVKGQEGKDRANGF